ncbi:BolA family protein [Chelatococcus asaccharovorans]|uniref:BolA protein family transcriptional regulator n=1 Tax=Chelatococcus asaccharovorans TaxID=28210 RepID=A0A2V3U7E0_9HYPH|nr:BolA family protein [Chelatococcus asaccharovorans]MBS7705996.1 BolA family transcriptional regulator [Chelatococcus asaccharovorans]PXW59017.1 BolA protein family transcriptional regulator [Chelatococcus asaccharovorans]CAH1659364.1 Cell division protein BolA [Chelatococcus asaccharovorans]CAH1684207.1 Cell division protein BolA [Chelatococcus asaccharovorans]
MARADRISAKLTAGLKPLVMNVVDESHQHAGHGGWREGGETHYRITIVADAFAGKSRLERHRLVNALLRDEFDTGLHALAIEAAAPGEAVRGL